LATLSAARTQNVLANGAPKTVALAAGYHLAFGVAACCLVVAMIVAATVLQTQILETATEAAA
jgi:hypothetical protein